MAANSTLIKEMKTIFTTRGCDALRRAKRDLILASKYDSNLSQALQYFSKVTLRNSMPVFPALVTISCEAVGGDAERAIPFGEAVVLIAGAADLHDDIIDQSPSKGPKQTVLGKFGINETILAGDILLTQGLILLNKASDSVPKKQNDAIRLLAADTLLNLCVAESLEIQLSKSKLTVTSTEFNQLINLKAVFPNFTMKLGAIIGNGTSQNIKELGEFGQIFGVISTMADEFSDLLNPDELTSRLKNECPPVPIIYALENAHMKTILLPLLNADTFNEKSHKAIIDLVLCSSETKLMITEWQTSVENQIKKLEKSKIKNREELETILLAPLEFLRYCSS